MIFRRQPFDRFASFAKMLLAASALITNLVALAGDASGRKLNFNPDWKFIRTNVPGAEMPTSHASGWATVSCPHTWNDTDTFDNFSTGGHTGESDLWTGVAWYRKEFVLPREARGKKVFIEFEGVRQIADVYLNGQHLGQDKTGFIPFGFDLTPHLKADATNVLAVRVDNRFDRQYTGDTPWNHPNWHPTHGGIYRNVSLHVTDPLHVTLPLYAQLQTEGIYVWTESLTKEMATVGITAEIQNEQPKAITTKVKFALVNRDGKVVAETTEEITLPEGKKLKVASELKVADPHLWQSDYPYVYQVRVSLSADGKVRDVAETPFGIRSFRFDVASGFWINGRNVKLHGWGQKPTDEWAGLGAALPDWLTDYTLRLMWEAGGNFLRWGHSAGPAVGAEFADKYGFVTIMPSVDGEKDCTGAAWQTRAAAFRNMLIYYRNHPSVCVWEGGNYNVSTAHAAELRKVVDEWDAHGQRYFGFRMSTPNMLPHVTIDITTIGRGRGLPSLPAVEGEYDRTEVPRRVWDKFSPPDFGHLGENEEDNTYHLTQEGFATNAISEWWTKFGSDGTHSGGANWIFSDGPHGSRQVTDAARASGEVDGVRLPKEAYFALQATWNSEPRVHFIGHWNYPPGTVKPMYAVARADKVELFVNGRSLGFGERSLDTLFTWTNVVFEPGEIKVVASRGGKVVAQQTKQTVGPAVALKLTPIVSPSGWCADGSDVALVDVEVVDAQGRRCPTDQARVDFEISGPGIWRGSYNSGKEASINHLYFDTECGINRASLRATTEAGEVTLIARREGLAPATLKLKSIPAPNTGGISQLFPSRYPTQLPSRPTIDATVLASQIAARNTPSSKPLAEDPNERLFSSFAYTGSGSGGMPDKLASGVLAYSDDAVRYLDFVPNLLKGARLIRTANNDRKYWANDYIVATAARDLDFFVAHDDAAPLPKWLQDFRATRDFVEVNGRKLALYQRLLKQDESLQISGNVDQGQNVGSALNFILFARPLGISTAKNP
jgi:beta-galactosidase